MIRKSRRKKEATADDDGDGSETSSCTGSGWFLRWMLYLLLLLCVLDSAYRYSTEAGLLNGLEFVLSARGAKERLELNKNSTTTTRVGSGKRNNSSDPTTTGTQSTSSHNYYDVCILGGGDVIGGAVLAEQYASQLGKTVLVLLIDDSSSSSTSGGSASAPLLRTDSYRVWQYVNQFTDWEMIDDENGDDNNTVVFRANPVDRNWVDQMLYKHNNRELVTARTISSTDALQQQWNDSNCGKTFYSKGGLQQQQNSTTTTSSNLLSSSSLFLAGSSSSATAAMTEIPSFGNDPNSSIGETIKATLEFFDRTAPKVLIQQWLWAHTGGPEALVQLALGFHSWMPTRTYVTLHNSNRKDHLPHWLQWYPELSSIPELDPNHLQKGDILILPCEASCLGHLVARGVRVYMYYLGFRNPNSVRHSIDAGCGYISHNYFLSHGMNVKIPNSHVMVPYMNPQKNGIVRNYTHTIEREDLVIVNVHDGYTNELKAIEGYCANRTPKPCAVTRIKGFTLEGLVELYRKAKIVVAFCLNGSERCPIEAVLNGAVMVSNPCLTALDKRDFPIPNENLITDANPAARVVQRIMDNFEEEQQRMEAMRQMYSSYGPLSLQRETKEFIFAMDKVKTPTLGT